MKESILQKLTIAHLQKLGYLVNKIILCTLNGWTDIEAYRKGKVIFVEVKTDHTEPNPLQLFRHEQIMNMGFKVFIIYNVADLDILS